MCSIVKVNVLHVDAFKMLLDPIVTLAFLHFIVCTTHHLDEYYVTCRHCCSKKLQILSNHEVIGPIG